VQRTARAAPHAEDAAFAPGPNCLRRGSLAGRLRLLPHAEVARHLTLLLFGAQLHTGLIAALLEEGQALFHSTAAQSSSEVGGRRTMVPGPGITGATLSELRTACMTKPKAPKAWVGL
jgi:hypothetical protein